MTGSGGLSGDDRRAPWHGLHGRDLAEHPGRTGAGVAQTFLRGAGGTLANDTLIPPLTFHPLPRPLRTADPCEPTTPTVPHFRRGLPSGPRR